MGYGGDPGDLERVPEPVPGPAGERAEVLDPPRVREPLLREPPGAEGRRRLADRDAQELVPDLRPFLFDDRLARELRLGPRLVLRAEPAVEALRRAVRGSRAEPHQARRGVEVLQG